MKKLLMLLMVAFVLSSCGGLTKIRVGEPYNFKVKSLSMSALNVVCDLDYSNGKKSVEIDDIFLDIYEGDKKISVLSLNNPITLEPISGVAHLDLRMRLSLAFVGTLIGKGVIDRDVSNIYATGYIAIGSGNKIRKLNIKRIELSDVFSSEDIGRLLGGGNR